MRGLGRNFEIKVVKLLVVTGGDFMRKSIFLSCGMLRKSGSVFSCCVVTGNALSERNRFPLSKNLPVF